MFIFLLQSIILQSMANIVPHKITCFFEYWEVHVLNHLPDNTNPLRLHCQSRDDDLGFHSISQQQDFNWHFCENFFHTTLFFCHLWWNSNMGPKIKLLMYSHQVFVRIAPVVYAPGLLIWMVYILPARVLRVTGIKHGIGKMAMAYNKFNNWYKKVFLRMINKLKNIW